MRRFTLRSLVLILFETTFIVAAICTAALYRFGDLTWLSSDKDLGYLKTLLVVVVAQASLYYADLYDLHLVSDRRERMIRILQALGWASLVLAAIYVAFPILQIGRGVAWRAAAIIIPVVIGWRMMFDYFSRSVGPRQRLLLVGRSTAAIALAKELYDRRTELGVEIVGFVDPDPAAVGTPVINPGVIGTVDDIPSIVRARNVDRVVVSLADARGRLPMDKLLDMKLERGVTFDHLATVYEEYTGKIAIENLRPSWLIFSEGFKLSKVVRASKRAMDVVFAVLGMVLAAPLMALAALAVKFSSPGPALYHQQRVGQHGKLFTVHKFRSMRQDAEANTGAVWATANDNRVTAIGRWLRRTRLDETPQLWNVLIGDMSMVGPRPERPEFVAQLTEQIPFYGLRNGVRPGVTGWAQVSYTYGATVEDALEKLQYDLFYIKHVSIPFDLYVLFQTIKTVVMRRGAQ